jgi:hypothetical protein
MNWNSLKATKGGKVTARIWNKLIGYLRRIEVTSVVGGRLIETELGKQIIIPKSAGGATPAPWNCTVTSGDSPSIKKVTVRPGYIDGNAPTISGTAINATPAPKIEIDATGAQEVWLKLKLTLLVANSYVYGATFSTATIGSGTAKPADDNAAGEYYLTLASFMDGVKATPQPVLVNLAWFVTDNYLGDSSASCTFIGR